MLITCFVDSVEVKLVGLKSNNSYLELNRRYSNIKCEPNFYNISCKLMFHAENNPHFLQTKHEAAIFQDEGTKMIKCSCGKSENKRYFSSVWTVHIGSRAEITSFTQENNYEVICRTNYEKEKTFSIMLDDIVLSTRNNTIEKQHSFDLKSTLNDTGEDFNIKNITCQTENKWGTQNKSFLLQIPSSYGETDKITASSVGSGVALLIVIICVTIIVCLNKKKKRNKKKQSQEVEIIPNVNKKLSMEQKLKLETSQIKDDKKIKSTVASTIINDDENLNLAQTVESYDENAVIYIGLDNGTTNCEPRERKLIIDNKVEYSEMMG